MSDTYDLRRGDDDAECKWGGATRGTSRDGTCASDAGNALAATSPVRDLQRDLRRVGIFLGPEPDGTFDIKTEWAVREFQIYAKMATVAKEDTASTAPEYVDKLSAVPTGTARYAGPVSGVYNAATRAAMTHWLAQSWRCPVVLDAWKAPRRGAPEERVARNAWGHEENLNQGVVKAVDFTGRFAVPLAQPWVIGARTVYQGKYGPWCTEQHAWQSMEVTPETLVGAPWTSLDAASRSTFRVTRAVAEIECLGYFDASNAYDNGVISNGIFHFIIHNGRGELAGRLDDWANTSASEYERSFPALGVTVRPQAAGEVAWFRLQDESGGYVPITTLSESEQQRPVPAMDYFRSWHWFYRFAMMSRSYESYRRRQWQGAIDRLTRIRETPFRDTAIVAEQPTQGGRRLAVIGDAFTSELVTAYLLRWHVNVQTPIVGSNRRGERTAGKKVVEAVQAARANAPQLDWTLPTSSWTQAHETALMDGLRSVVPSTGPLVTTLPEIELYPNQPSKKPQWQQDRTVLPLSRARGSFLLATAAPAPAPPGPTPPLPPSPAPPGPAPASPRPSAPSPPAPVDPAPPNAPVTPNTPRGPA